MNRLIQSEDKRLLRQRVLNLRIRIDVYNDEMVYVDTIHCGLVSGTCTIDASSDIRRTASFVLIPSKKVNTLIEEDSLIWLNRNIVLYIGVQNIRNAEYTWYKQGTYLIQTYNSTYDATNNQLTINCADWMAKLDGTKNGQLGALVTSFPAYKEYQKDAENIYTIEECSYGGSTYKISIEKKKKFNTGDYLVIKIPKENKGKDALMLNGEISYQMTNLLTAQNIQPGTLRAGYYYAFMVTSATTIALTSTLPIERLVDGIPLNYYIIRDGVITALTRLGGITDYNIDDIGEYLAIPQYNKDYEQYRLEHPLWNNIPYNLEYQVGGNVLEILTAFRDLYPNYEMFFDEDGVFVAQMIPSAVDDDIWLDNEFLQTILISENFSIDSTTIKNVTEVWGAALEVDFTSKSCELNDKTYTLDIDEYGEEYYSGDKIAITFDAPNPEDARIRIHTKYTETPEGATEPEEKEVTLDELTILDQMTDLPLVAGVIQPGVTYVCKIRTRIENNEPVKHLYFLSQYQPQAINVLTDGTTSNENYTCADGKVVKKYSLDYFRDFYNCRIVSFTVDRNSPYTIQKLGVILNVFNGGEFDNIESDQRALARAEYENWKTAILTDQITLTTKICPWLDVNKKISYRRSDRDVEEQYIIQSVSHDVAGGTSSITLNRFRPLYMDEDYIGGFSNDELATKTHYELSKYKYSVLAKGR